MACECGNTNVAWATRCGRCGEELELDNTKLLARIAQDVSSVRSYLAFFAGAFVVSVGITIVLWVIVSS